MPRLRCSAPFATPSAFATATNANVPLLGLRSTTLGPADLATTRSSAPSPLKSAAAMSVLGPVSPSGMG